MSNVVRGLVEGIGIAASLPEHLDCFTEETFPETIVIPCEKPDMEQLLSVMVDVEVVSVRVAKTPVEVTSPEGQHLTGRKLIIELKLREKVKYVADEPTQSVHAAHYENVLKSVFVVVHSVMYPPSGAAGIPIEELLRLNRVIVTPYVEDIYAKMVDCRTIFKNIAILIDVKFNLNGL